MSKQCQTLCQDTVVERCQEETKLNEEERRPGEKDGERCVVGVPREIEAVWGGDTRKAGSGA